MTFEETSMNRLNIIHADSASRGTQSASHVLLSKFKFGMRVLRLFCNSHSISIIFKATLQYHIKSIK